MIEIRSMLEVCISDAAGMHAPPGPDDEKPESATLEASDRLLVMSNYERAQWTVLYEIWHACNAVVEARAADLACAEAQAAQAADAVAKARADEAVAKARRRLRVAEGRRTLEARYFMEHNVPYPR
jgi:hypothetical protein